MTPNRPKKSHRVKRVQRLTKKEKLAREMVLAGDPKSKVGLFPAHPRDRERTDQVEQHAKQIGDQTKNRRGEDRGEEHPGIDEPGVGQAEALCVLEILDREGRAEREEYRREEHVEPEDVPIGAVEMQQLAPLHLWAALINTPPGVKIANRSFFSGKEGARPVSKP